MRAPIPAGTISGSARSGRSPAAGSSPDAVKNAMLAIGIGDTDISFSWDNLYAENRKIVDPVANRYFFVPIRSRHDRRCHPHTAHAMLHPVDAARGTRTLEFEGPSFSRRARSYRALSMVRLKDLFNVKIAWDGRHPRVFLWRGFACGCPGSKGTYHPVAAGTGLGPLHAPYAGRRDDRCL